MAGQPLLRPLGESACALAVRAQPGAKRSGLDGLWNGRLKVRLRERAVDGAANAALLELLAGALRVRRAQVALLSGERGRLKELRVELPEPVVRARLEALLGGAGGLASP